ncbi:MAG: PqqD family protein [Planctomycetales bacterium]|nr:PqqD family protein [Planctomycetales bacterium]
MYYVRRNELSAQEVDGEVVLLDAAGERIHQLNGTASLIWHRCDDKTTIDDLVELLMAHFDVDRTTALGDVSEFVDQLCTLKILTRSER